MSTAKPYFQEIADEITDSIRKGKLRSGDQLPSTAELALKYDVSVATAYRAVRELHRRGLVLGRRGKGVFVA